MDKEKDDNIEEEIEKPKKKKGKGLTMIVVILIAVLAGGGGAFFFLSGSSANTAQKKVEANAKEECPMFALDPFVVNLSDQGQARFLKVSMQLELANQAAMERAKAKTPQIRDAVIALLTSETSDSLMSPEGKLQLKDKINMTGNQILGNDTLKDIYFTDFVMQ